MRRVKETVHYFCNDTLFGHIDGHGVTTAVLDTGISPHSDLKGRIVAFGDMLYGKKRMTTILTAPMWLASLQDPEDYLPDSMRELRLPPRS